MEKRTIAIVDHSYHKRTKSTEFLFDLFREQFEVEVFFDESWRSGWERYSMGGMPVRGNYEWIVFLQVFPPPGSLRLLKCKNILCVPMLDGMIGSSPDFFTSLRNCYFLSFSRTLHDFLGALGYRSLYLQYFPETCASDNELASAETGSRNKSAFFWQRRTPVTVDVVKSLLGVAPSINRLHIHCKADPGFEYLEKVEPEFPDTLEVSQSTWLGTRTDFHRLLTECGVFFAPRQYEGIGMSFLEAMSLGKCVVSPDSPTANEYIQHGVTGLLYDPSNPEVLDFDSVSTIRKNALEFVRQGRENYVAGSREFVANLVQRNLSCFNGFLLAKASDPVAALELRHRENLELIREYTSRPWLTRTVRRYLLEALCIAGFMFARIKRACTGGGSKV